MTYVSVFVIIACMFLTHSLLLTVYISLFKCKMSMWFCTNKYNTIYLASRNPSCKERLVTPQLALAQTAYTLRGPYALQTPHTIVNNQSFSDKDELFTVNVPPVSSCNSIHSKPSIGLFLLFPPHPSVDWWNSLSVQVQNAFFVNFL